MNQASRHRLGVLLVAGAAVWWSTVSAAATMFLFLTIRKRVGVFRRSDPIVPNPS